MTAPLTPADSDLRDFRFMPLDVVRLAHSDLVAFEDPAAVVAAILLWGASWHSVPAGSLSNDDRALARAAGFGRGLTEWLAVKDGALRGFIECSDGRLYHPVVAEKVREAWAGKLRQRHRTFLAAVRKHNERNPMDQREGPSYEAWEAMGRPREVAALTQPAQQPRLALAGGDEDRLHGDDPGNVSHATDGNVTRDNTPKSRVPDPRVTQDSPSKGEGEGQGQGQGDSLGLIHTSDADAKNGRMNDDPVPIDRDQLLAATASLARVGGVSLNPSRIGPFTRELDLVKGWITDGIDLDQTAAPAISRRLATTSEDRIQSLKFYDADVRKAHARKLGGNADPATDAAWTPEKRQAYLASIADQ